MNKVTIDRELLERISDPFTSTEYLLDGLKELRAILAVQSHLVSDELSDECERLGRELYERNNELSACEAERDTLRQQLAEEREHYTFATEKLFAAEAQRDKLAELLRELYEAVGEFAWDSDLEQRIDAALAEVKPCQESPAPTT